MLTAADGVTIVAIEADGPLPTPTVGVLDGPPRIYLDFPGIVGQTQSIRAEGDPSIRRVRVATHSQNPLVTRVVIDLVRPTPHRLEASPEAPARLTVLVGSPGETGGPSSAPPSAAPPPAPVPVPPPSPAASTPSSPISVPPPSPLASPPPARLAAPRAEPYLAQLAPLLARLENLRPVLVAIDKQEDQQAVNLQRAIDELGAIGRALITVRPPRAMTEAHDQLLQSCTLGTQAARGRIEFTAGGNATVGWNAASAAAGALLLLDRARATLGLPSGQAKSGL